MGRRFVLNDLLLPNAGALLASRAQEKTTVACRSEQGGTGRGQVGVGIEILCYADRMPKDDGVDVVVGIDIDAAHKLDELSCLGAIVAAGLIQSLANEVECHCNFRVLQVRLSYTWSQSLPIGVNGPMILFPPPR